MKIAIDARISRRWDAGAGRFATSVATVLAEMGHSVTIISPLTAVPALDSRVAVEFTDIAVASVAQHAAMPRVLRRLSPDGVLVTHPFAACVWDSAPTLLTILDVYPVRFPRYFDWRAVAYYRFLLPNLARRKRRLLAISEATKRDVVQYLHVPAERVTVAHLAAPRGFANVPDSQERRDRLAGYGILGPYLLYHGNKRPHKNLPRLIAAFARIVSNFRSLQLVITGRENASDPEQNFDELRSVVKRLGLEPAVRLTGFVPDWDLPALYSAATATVIPSLFEGFGLPAIESMACGTPVVAARTGALPEVVGDAGLLINPLSEDELASALLSITVDASLRSTLARRCAARAAEFSWATTADTIVEALREEGRTP